LARNLASLCFGREPKAKVMTTSVSFCASLAFYGMMYKWQFFFPSNKLTQDPFNVAA
jgi:hypothetical protein